MESIIMPQHLLLLTVAQGSPDFKALRAAYGPALTSALTQLSNATLNATAGASLDVALPLSLLYDNQDMPRSSLYKHVQAVVAGVYKLICVIAATRQINVEDYEGIDVRVIIITSNHHDRQLTHTAGGGASMAGNARMMGPLVSLETLARRQRPWQSVFAMEGQDGDDLLRAFLVMQDSRMNVRHVPGGQVSDAVADFELDSEDARQHTSIAVGGTWDHIHIGHKLLLTMFAFMLQPQNDDEIGSLTVGITGDELLKNKKFAEVLESWHDRQRSVIRFLKAIMDFRPLVESELDSTELSQPGPNGHAIHYSIDGKITIKMVEIADPFGPTITDETISALVLSAETRSGGKAVNEKREVQGWKSLDVFEVDVIDAEEDSSGETADTAFASKLSSTDIRKKLSEKGKLRSRT